MRLKILLLGHDPVSMVADAQLLRERSMLVYTAYNLQNINELIGEVKPDVIFFDVHKSNNEITDAYNNMIKGTHFATIPVIFTLTEDDLYLVTRKRTDTKDKRSLIADNMIDAIRLALHSNKTYHKKSVKTPDHGNSGNIKPMNHGTDFQLRIPF
jgi:response regulator RpfG family c-di-GMP phosphodiesterase